jgi:formylglycine-generating enzyme required for sulfatase activity
MKSLKILTTFFLTALAGAAACGSDEPTPNNSTTTATGAGGAGGAGGGGTTASTGTSTTTSTSTSTTTSGGGAGGGWGGEALSCEGGAPGQDDCGPGSESCCTSLLVPGGTVQLDSTHTATVSDFRLDKYQVTVGRFRAFVEAWADGWRPSAGAGKHVHLNGGNGLSDGGSGFEAGWDPTWNASLGTTKSAWDTNLACHPTYKTWTSGVGANEKRPINCATWFEQAAFCIWDGGFLPSEAEWQYAAAGGSEGRQYPWSNPPSITTIDCTYANYFGCGTNTKDVGSTSPKGDGRWGHSDLAGNVWEWALDWYKSFYPLSSSSNYTNVTTATGRVIRGGGFNYSAWDLLASARLYYSPSVRDYYVGARCARPGS